MISETGLITICGLILTGWNGFLHMKIYSICKNCKYSFTPKEKIKEKPIAS